MVVACGRGSSRRSQIDSGPASRPARCSSSRMKKIRCRTSSGVRCGLLFGRVDLGRTASIPSNCARRTKALTHRCEIPNLAAAALVVMPPCKTAMTIASFTVSLCRFPMPLRQSPQPVVRNDDAPHAGRMSRNIPAKSRPSINQPAGERCPATEGNYVVQSHTTATAK